MVSYHDILLTRALKHTATDIANLSQRPGSVLHIIQAEVLLANYFFRNGQFLEAKCHSGVAVSLTLGCGLHKIRSSQPVSQYPIGVIANTTTSLHQTPDDVEEGERINGFWTVLILHKTLAVALDPPTNVCGALEAPGIQIDTPWPLNIESYKEVCAVASMSTATDGAVGPVTARSTRKFYCPQLRERFNWKHRK